MITVEEAKDLIFQNVDFFDQIIEINVQNSLGYKLASDIFSPLDLPSFNQSNVDGYAICGNEKSWKILNEIKAGDSSELKLKKGECVRIFTGAFVPENTDAIVMQEHIDKNAKEITLKNGLEYKVGQQIRKKGTQIKNGDLALKAGITLTPAALSLLHMLGIKEVEVFKKPRVSLIITGNELQFPGEKLDLGKVFEANALAIQSQLKAIGIHDIETTFVKDEKESLKKCFSQSLIHSDFILFSGGISVGDYDFVKEINDELDTTCIFHKIAQKPGKPLYFGKNQDKIIFALPGNPASAITCMYEYVIPSLKRTMGENSIFLPEKQVKLHCNYSKKTGLAHFLKARFENDSVCILEGQDSFIMKSFSEANCLVYLPSEIEEVTNGDVVEIHIL